jgi:protoporphyrinogen/coproporphyrinogen III oxidase
MKIQVTSLILLVTSAYQGNAFTVPRLTASGSFRASSSLQATQNVDCLVVGGGISGSTLAHNVHYQSNGETSVLLTEARDYIGGNVKSHRTEDGFLWEEGPNSFATQPSIIRISHELGIDDQLVFANESLPPWVNFDGKLHPLPKGQGGKGPKGQLELVFGPNGVLKFALAGELLSWPGKIRAGIGAFLGHLPPPSRKEETIREWVTRILGEEVFLRCIDPFVSGVYAGNPETLSMSAALSKINRIENYAYDIEWNKFGAIFYGGLARQVELTKERKADPPKPEWIEFEYGNPGSYREGLSTLPKAIHKELGDKVKTEWTLVNIEFAPENSDGYKYIATYDTPSGEEKVQTKTIVSTIPAHALKGRILDKVMPEATKIFNKIRSNVQRKGIYYPPVVACTVAYPKSSFKDVELPNGFGNLQNLPGFGSLNPRTEGVRTLGTLWSSSLFPGRCPEDYNLLLNYIGGSRDPSLAELTEEEIIGEVDKGCRQVLLKKDAPAPKVIGMKVWPTAIPQYELGHLEMMDELQDIEDEMDGLWICGNYRSGVAFPDCVTFGYEQAQTVLDFLKNGKSNKRTKKISSSSAVSYTMSADLDGFEFDKVVTGGLGVEEEVEKEIADVNEVISSIESDMEVIEEPTLDVSIPYDAAAKLAYEGSDKSMDYDDFKLKYEADCVELVKSKRKPSSAVEVAAVKEAHVVEMNPEAFQRQLLAARLKYSMKTTESKTESIIDVSIPYDAAAKNAYEASDQSMSYDDFKAKYEADAIKLVKSKQKPVLEEVKVNKVQISPEIQIAKEMEAKQRALLAARLQSSSKVVMK